MEEPLPSAMQLALLICYNIHTDPYTHRKTLLGLFDEFVAAEYPTVIPICHFYAEVTEMHEPTSFRVQVLPADPDAEPVWKSDPVEVDPDSPLFRAFLNWPAEEVPLPEVGVYLVQLLDEYERVIDERPLYARLPSPPAMEDS